MHLYTVEGWPPLNQKTPGWGHQRRARWKKGVGVVEKRGLGRGFGRPVQWKVKTGRSVKTGDPSGKSFQLEDKACEGVCEMICRVNKAYEIGLWRGLSWSTSYSKTWNMNGIQSQMMTLNGIVQLLNVLNVTYRISMRMTRRVDAVCEMFKLSDYHYIPTTKMMFYTGLHLTIYHMVNPHIVKLKTCHFPDCKTILLHKLMDNTLNR